MTLLAITGLPILLTGAALVGLPVLLHLIMRQEPKRLPFPAFRFLKQQRQLNQRKIRLRHLLLLLLRMGLIALICLSLWQPTVLSDGFSLRGGRPIAAMVVLDTSPSMGYVLAADRSGLTAARQRALKLLEEPAQGPWTCLDEARGRALEMLEDLPPGSRVAVLDTGERSEPTWSTDLAAARQRIRDLKKPRANSQPVSRALESAYSVLARLDLELEPGQEPFPRLLAVFSDRTASSWDVSRTAELQSFRDRVPAPSVYPVYVDVGVDKPVNTAITTIDFKPQLVPENQPVVLTVTVETTGGATANILLFSVDGEEPQRMPVNPGPDRPITRQLRKDGLKPGLHHAKISLLTSDALPFDNEKFVTFRVREPRRVLALVDVPTGSFLTRAARAVGLATGPARLWTDALDAKGWYTCDVRPATAAETIDFTRYEAVVLLDLRAPSRALWLKLDEYLRVGGNVIVTPPLPGEGDMAAYQSDAAERVLPRKYTRWNEKAPGTDDFHWAWGSLSPNRPLLAKFREDEQKQFLESGEGRPTSAGFWKVEDGAGDRVVVAYNDAPQDPDSRSPAVLEGQPLGARGKVLQFTVPLGVGAERVHNYWSSWFAFVLVNEAVRTLVGDSEDQSFNFTGGENVIIKWPADAKPGAVYYVSGPDVAATDAVIRRDEGQAFLRFGPEKTAAAGHFTVQSEDGTWTEGFSINAAVSESNLERLPPGPVAELFGPEALTPADKQRPLDDILSGRFTQPIELFPFLMILLLLVLAGENLLANKFYRRRKDSGP